MAGSMRPLKSNFLHMKRNKVNGDTTPGSAPYHGVLFGGESMRSDENDLSRVRMLESLKNALFFNRIQAKMDKERREGS